MQKQKADEMKVEMTKDQVEWQNNKVVTTDFRGEVATAPHPTQFNIYLLTRVTVMVGSSFCSTAHHVHTHAVQIHFPATTSAPT